MEIADKGNTENSSSESKRIRIGIADEHKLFRQSLKETLESKNSCHVVIQASDGIELEEKLLYTKVDVILINVYLPNQNGIITTKNILKNYPSIKIIAISDAYDEELILTMIEMGVSGYFTKYSNLDDLHKGILDVFGGGYFFDKRLREIISTGIRKSKEKHTTANPIFSDIELKVLNQVCDQLSNDEIASNLGLSKRTIETHRRRLLEKTQCKKMVGVVIYCIQRGFLDIRNFNYDFGQDNSPNQGLA